MKKQLKQSEVRRFLCVSLLIFGISVFSSMIINATTVSYESPTYSSYTPYGAINILSDINFIDYGFPGSGTAEDPYLIEGYNITTAFDNGIHIYGTTKYFIVRNCYIDAVMCGIHIDNVADGIATVINNTCNNNIDYGIRLETSGSSTVVNNTCNNNWQGIKLDSSVNPTVINNTCNNGGYGIYLLNSGSSTVANNTCNDNNYGIYLLNSGSSMVTNNTCSNNIVGIELDTSVSLTVINNTCNNNINFGIYLRESSGSTVASNTCENNDNFEGIKFYYSGSAKVENNSCSNNGEEGIILSYSNYSNVTKNTCNNNGGVGIWLLYSYYSNVTNNTCNNNSYWGIGLSNSDFCVITYNLLKENERYGIVINSVSDNCTIHYNTLVENQNLVGASQAFDDGANNTWYDTATLEGNWWSDWSGTGNYSIDGSANSEDLYPLDEPTVYPGPPVITNIIHSPSSPTELDTISINATVTSPYDVQSVTLHYRINDGSWQTISMILVSGDLYSVTLGSFAVGDTIEYYVSAVDNSINHNEAINDNSGLYYSFTIDSSDNTGPAINDVVHSPSTPTELDTISINATVTDDSGIYNVTLHYKINIGSWQTISMTLVSGDLYSVTLGSFAVGDIIEYYISAVDNSYNHNEATEDNGGLYYIILVGSSDNTGPAIDNIIHSPATPTELDTVIINATVTDDSTIHNVTLHYKINIGSWQTISMTLVSGDLYSVTIGSFAVGDTIEYYITAVDNSINYNEATEDNSGLYYSFTVSEVIPEFQTLSLLLPAITSLFLICGLVVLQRRKK